ncbi:MAG TPA: bifunctional 2-polyprenyl-6-hydroxyphenol methylase/3-demethylubiquinol 3-O-methyltransferase UbiG [Ktedonobacteraceae bacterium]|nr:bifunctional 2-polyprenyl-6-hydroxyphenol methylase/3-demethylubiquinol 3-O-methyltransferase UbiG [Ktedonobacteraceae bacterium]
MPVDNELYNRLSNTWWDENAVLNILRTWLNPVRFGYFQRILSEQLKLDPRGKETLDIGCGGGLLAEEFARIGCKVTGIDPSEPSIEVARAHEQQSDLNITYLVGVGEHLPFADATFDIVYCCDVLEHVSDLSQVIAQTARVLKPGGVFFYDTINRNILSNLVLIKMAQEWKSTRFMPPNIHAWQQFIKPQELITLMGQHGLRNQDIKGMSPAANPFTILSTLHKRNRNQITFVEAGKILRWQESGNLLGSYMGYALKSMS